MRISTAKSILDKIVKSNVAALAAGDHRETITPFLRGDPGVGKTELVRQVAAENGLLEHTLIVAQFDPAELGGFPFPQDGLMVRLRPEDLPSEGNGILFLDELVQASVAVQNLIAQLVQERRIGKHRIGDGWQIIAAGNKQSNKAGTTQMPSHLKDRILFMDLEADHDEFVSFGNARGIDPLIVGYIRNRPDWLHKFDPAQDACPSPRSWFKVSRLLSMGFSEGEEHEVLAGTIGAGAAGDFAGYLRLFREMPDVEVILADPEKAPLPKDPQAMYALSAVIGRAMDVNTADAAMIYMARFKRDEFVAFAVVDAMSAKPSKGIHVVPAVGKWVRENGMAIVSG